MQMIGSVLFKSRIAKLTGTASSRHNVEEALDFIRNHERNNPKEASCNVVGNAFVLIRRYKDNVAKFGSFNEFQRRFPDIADKQMEITYVETLYAIYDVILDWAYLGTNGIGKDIEDRIAYYERAIVGAVFRDEVPFEAVGEEFTRYAKEMAEVCYKHLIENGLSSREDDQKKLDEQRRKRNESSNK